MKKSILAALPLAVLALAAPAAAEDGGKKHGGKRAVTYKAKVVPVAPAPEVVASRDDEGSDSAPAEGAEDVRVVRGKAELVDGRRRDKVQLRVKGLEPGAGYTWSVRKVSADAEAATDGDEAGSGAIAPACAGEAVDAFEYAAFEGRRHGHARARARSRAFSAEEGATYVVVVTDAEGADVACGEFRSKAQRKADRKAAKRKAGKHKSGRGDDDAKGEDGSEDESGDDKDESTDDEGADDSADDSDDSDVSVEDDEPVEDDADED